MNNFTGDDFGDMQITKMSYNEETRGWTFFVMHNDYTYSIKDFDLPHPDDISDRGHIVSIVRQKMLMVENKSAKEIVKRVIDVQENEILYRPFTELEVVEYVKPEEPQLLEYDGPGYENFFLDNFDIYKGNINIILDLDSKTWIPGKYMKSTEWVQMYSYRLANIKGNKIKLFPLDRTAERKQGTWDYWDGSSLNTLEYNGVITKEMVIGGGDGSKYNVHFILDTDTMTWNYGPDNVDSAWIGEGKQIYIQGIKVLLKTKRSELGYAWEYL
jgi:hypothetical protein